MAQNIKNGSFALDLDTLPDLWRDRKRYFGLPLSFTSYRLNASKLLLNTGMFNLKEEEILLYRIRDISVSETLIDRLFGVGTLTLTSSDTSHPTLTIQHVKKPRLVKEALSKCIEDDRRKRKIRATELMDTGMPLEESLESSLDSSLGTTGADELTEPDEQIGM